MGDSEGTDEVDARAIRRRRDRLIALALAGAATVSATACACLRMDVRDAGPDAGAVDAGEEE